MTDSAGMAGGVRVCLVEDHAVLREQLVGLLVSSGVDVVAAVGTAHEGLKVIVEMLPDIAVVDNRLPDGRGTDLCRTLSELVPGVTVLLHTGTVSAEDEEAARAAGAAEIVAKSVRGQNLLDAIRVWGSGSRRPES